MKSFSLILSTFLCCSFGILSHGQGNTSYGTSAGNTGSYNSAFGEKALDIVTGDYNTASGYESLYSNTTGYDNAAFGASALNKNTTGDYNAAFGGNALYYNTTGHSNTASGSFPLYLNTTGYQNTASGILALFSNTTGYDNTASGTRALFYNTSGFENTALGSFSGPTLNNLSNTTALGYNAILTASNSVQVGNTSVTSIGGQVGWTTFSDGRFKKEVKEDTPGLEFITQLRPVSYNVDNTKLKSFMRKKEPESKQGNNSNIQDIQTKSRRETGFIAQEVEGIVKASGYVFNGVDEAKNKNDIYGIRYGMFVVPLVKAVQELNDKQKELLDIIEKQQEQINALLSKTPNETNTIQGSNESFGSASKLFQIVPNPFSEKATVSMDLAESVNDAKIMIYTLEGKQLNAIPVTTRGKTSVEISVNELQAGMYLYTLITNGRIVDTKRMILK